MVFMLSTLSSENYKLYRVIVAAIEKVKVKGIAAPKVDCKGNNFRGLRRFSKTDCTEMLCLKVSIQLASTKKKKNSWNHLYL